MQDTDVHCVLNTAVIVVDSVKSRALQSLCRDMNTGYDALLCDSHVCLLSHGYVFLQVFELRREMTEMHERKNPPTHNCFVFLSFFKQTVATLANLADVGHTT